MELVLTVIAAPPQSPLLGQTRTLTAAGLTFGRAADNGWVLDDPERVVSSRHATIAFQGGRFTLIDHSTNGTFVNGGGAALGQGNSTALVSGDIVAMGGYQVQVILRTPAPAPVSLLDGGSSFLDQMRPAGAAAPAAPPPAAAAPSALDDFDRWLEPAAPSAQTPAWGSVPPAAMPGPSAYPGPSGLPGQSTETDPLALLGGGNNDFFRSAPDSDDWWQSSQPDNAPADQHHVHIPQPQFASPPAAFAPPPAFESPAPSSEAVDIDQLLGLDAAPAPQVPPVVAPRADITAPVTQRPAAPPPAPAAPATPPPARTPTPAPTPAAAAAVGGDLAQQLAARLGLERLGEAELNTLVDEVTGSLRETAARLIDILRARSSIKNELRLERTMLGATENNPLKFSVRGEDALAYMFEDRGGAFLRAEAAIRDSFDDLADHQVAVLAGMRAAYESMLASFDPAQLEQGFGSGGSLLANRKARNWEAFVEHFEKLKGDGESTYSRLFGGVFAEAYERQIHDLKAARRFNGR